MAITLTYLEIHQGDDETYRLTVTDSDGSAHDISAWSDITFVAKDRGDDATSVISLSLGSGIALVTDGTDGLADITITSADTSGQTPRELVFAIRRVLTALKKTIARGTLAIIENITD